jgi:O-antigen/teichoic acid export membrane protein
MSTKFNVRALAGTSVANLTIHGCNIMTGILTARLLHPVGRGELAAIILWPTILESLGLMGVDWALARKAAAKPEEPNLERTALFLGLAMGLCTVLLGFILVPHLLPNDKRHFITLTQIYLLNIPLSYISANLLALDKGRMCWARFNWVRLTYTFPYLLIIVMFWVFGLSEVQWFVMALLMSTLLTTIVRVLLSVQKIFPRRSTLREGLDTMRRAFPFCTGIVSSVVSQQIDKALVVFLLPMAEVGYYAAALTFASAHSSLRSALGITSFAAMANEPDRGRQGLMMAEIFRQSTWLMVLAGGGVACLAVLLITPLFGREFFPAVRPAVFLAVATSLIGLHDILNEGMWGIGKTYPGIGANLTGVVVLAISAWYFVPHFGLMGMAGAMIFASLVRLMILIIAACFLLRLRPGLFWGLNLYELKVLSSRLISVLAHYKRA